MDMANPIYTDKDKAREYLEAIRWPTGIVCPHCGCTGKITEAGRQKHPPRRLQMQ